MVVEKGAQNHGSFALAREKPIYHHCVGQLLSTYLNLIFNPINNGKFDDFPVYNKGPTNGQTLQSSQNCGHRSYLMGKDRRRDIFLVMAMTLLE